jgi:hypothetical protein
MKYYLFILSFSLLKVQGYSQNNALNKPTTSFLLDSLSHLNYYDFYGKSVEDLLSNKMINSYTDYYLLSLEHDYNTIERNDANTNN